ncbi:MAG: hypothetical protein U0821_02305 [Chloroflexota bacterium]
MFGFILGAIAGAAGYWAYQRYVIGSDDDAFADFETSSLDRPGPTEIHSRPAESSTSSGSDSSAASSS